ncbi:MFS transporter (plasmid) [Arthrobacter sp. D3-16]
MSTANPNTFREQPKLSGWRAAALISTLVVATVTFQLTASMVTPALPQMAATFGEGPASAAPLQSMFFLAAAISVPIVGRWSDFIGRRSGMLVALAVVVAGTILCIAAPTLQILLTGRILQGAGGAMFTLAYIVLRENLHARVFGISLGIVAAISGGVGGLDGFIGGLMTETLGFRSIFVVVLAVAAIAGISILKMVPKGRPHGVPGRMDWWGAGSLSLFLIFLTYFISEGSSAGWTTALSLALLIGTVLTLAAFWTIEKRCSHPLIAIGYLRSRQFWPVIATSTLALAGMFALLNFTVVLLSQDVDFGFGLSPSLSALLFLAPPALLGVCAAPLAGWIADRRGWLMTLRLGGGFSLAFGIVAATFSTNLLVVALSVAGLGISYTGFLFTSLNGLSVLLSPAEAPAALPGLTGASFSTGAGLGIVLVQPFTAQAASFGYGPALWASVGITAAACLVTFLVPAPNGEKLRKP